MAARQEERGEALMALLGDELRTTAPGTSGERQGSVRGFKSNVERAAGDLPLRAMPDWLRPLMGWLMPKIGPEGLEFARARLEMKALETVLHLRRQHPRRMRNMVAEHVWRIVAPYDLHPSEDEGRRDVSGPESEPSRKL